MRGQSCEEGLCGGARLLLASTSSARRSLLYSAGIEPVCLAPEVDERKMVAAREQEIGRALTAAETVALLAQAKAEDVVRRHGPHFHELFTNPSGQDSDTPEHVLVLGGDSAFELDGEVFGKPHKSEIAFSRARAHRGRTGILHSGHHLIACTLHGKVLAAANANDKAHVTMSAEITDDELRAYIRTGEPLKLAGGFAIDGLAAPFIERIEGAPSCVVGLSLPLLRRLVRKIGYEYTALWGRNSSCDTIS